MANRVRTLLLLCPNMGLPPDGPIKIGNVLASIKTPEIPLHTAPLPTAHELFSTEKRQVEFSYEKLRESRFSIITKFLCFLGVGVDAGVERSKGTGEAFSFERLETTQYFPRDEYLQACVGAAPVRRFLEKSRYKKPLYIITGLNTVRGASANSFKTNSQGGGLEVEVNGSIWSGGAAPVTGGPGIAGSVSRKEGTSWKESSDFILAYRVRKITFSKSGPVKSNEDYTKGAMLGNAEVDIQTQDFDILVEDTDLSQGDEDSTPEEVTDGEDSIICCRAK
ncbi:hypothetical protein PG996_012320 [Apiospora saccharicola]|uniref:Uncharacterized protein n=1 Tax=Apiospora saccharicola TaxID=335842 RepID=A0ABR1U287_9PEZI